MDHLESIRSILKTRDDMDDQDITEMLEEAREEILEGADPQDVLQDIFGLEPDYIMDFELGLF